MRDIRNLAGKLVCRIDEDVGVIEIRRNGYRTLLRLWPKAQVLLFVTNTKHIRRH
jgi:hypothetical protein